MKLSIYIFGKVYEQNKQPADNCCHKGLTLFEIEMTLANWIMERENIAIVSAVKQNCTHAYQKQVFIISQLHINRWQHIFKTCMNTSNCMYILLLIPLQHTCIHINGVHGATITCTTFHIGSKQIKHTHVQPITTVDSSHLGVFEVLYVLYLLDNIAWTSGFKNRRQLFSIKFIAPASTIPRKIIAYHII